MRVDFGAGGARHVGDEVGEVGGGLQLDFAVSGGGGAGAGEGVCFEDCWGGHCCGGLVVVLEGLLHVHVVLAGCVSWALKRVNRGGRSAWGSACRSGRTR
jgi:hypothetical protein